MSFYASKHSPYISRHRNALTFRIRIPVDIQACLGRREYRRSLGRCYATEGKLRSLKLALAAHEVFTFAREALQARLLLGQNLTGITDTGKVRTSLPPNVSTPSRQKQEQSLMAQEHTAGLDGYTNGSELHGRPLASYV